MRRRRNADAPVSNDANPSTAETNTELNEVNATTAPASDPELTDAAPLAAEEKPKRRSSPRKKAATAAAAEAELAPASEPAGGSVTALPPTPVVDLIAATPLEVPPVSSESPAITTEAAEPPKRAPRTRRKKTADTEAAPAASPALQNADVSAEIAARAEAVAEPVSDAEEDTTTAQPEATEATAEAEPGRPKRSRNRRGRKPQSEETATPGVATNATSQPESPAVSTDGRPGRTRGPQQAQQRRRLTPEERAALLPAIIPAPAASPATPAPPPPAGSAPPTGEGETTPGPARQRVRGLRRAPAARAATVAPTLTPTVVPAVSTAELLPPAYQPLPAEVLARLPETRVEVRKGAAELLINGEPKLPLWFFVNTETSEDREVATREIRLAYEAGIRFFTVLAHLPWKRANGERRFDPLDEALQFVADNAPEAFVLPRLIFSPPASWERANPDQMTRFPNGEMGDISLASRSFWEGEAEGALRAAVERVAQGPHATRVFGFYLEHGEWFHEKGRGYDVSEANLAGFRSYLRTRYKNNQTALRAAWNDGVVTFEDAQIPSWPPPAGPTLFFSSRERRWTDFHEYSSDIVAQVITRLAGVAKEASGGRSAVAVSYGYTLELPRAASGHLALGAILASPHIDILTGPISYSARMPGGSAPLPAPIDSVLLAGKLWISEDDTKTYLAEVETADSFNPRITSPEGTRAVHSRNLGAALVKGCGVSWMDLWGEGWLGDRDIWQTIGRLCGHAERLAERRRASSGEAPPPDVAVIVDERSFFGVRTDEALLGHLISQQRDCLQRSGARIGYYLLSDLTKKNFPDCRLLLFLNAFQFPEAVKTALKERFQDGGRTLAWLYGPGSQEESNEATAATGGVTGAAVTELADVIGIQLRLQPWGSKVGTQISSSARSPLTEALRGQRVGEELRVNPSFFVVDLKAQTLGEYVGTGNVSLAVRKHPRWQSVFIGETMLSLPLLRGLYRLAGVPTYTVDDDVAWVGDRLLCLHSAPGGGTTVYLPEEAVLYDLLAEETLASGGYGARLSMPPRGTRLLFWGTAEEVARLGGDPQAAARGLGADERLPALVPFALEGGTAGATRTSAASASEVSPEDEALFAAALAGTLPLSPQDEDDIDDAPQGEVTASVPVEAAETAEDAAGRKKKRRRRRRGRGRGVGEDDLLSPQDGDLLSEDDDENDLDEETAEAADAAAEVGGSVNPVVGTPPGPLRARPSLEELLPLSDVPDDGAELPPIPDEFLPMGDLAITSNSGSEGEEEVAGVEEMGAARRPRTRTRPRRGSRRLTNTDEVSETHGSTGSSEEHSASGPFGEPALSEGLSSSPVPADADLL